MNLVPSVLGKKPTRELDSSRSLPSEFGHRRAQNDNMGDGGWGIEE
jgi:hypothetical protein